MVVNQYIEELKFNERRKDIIKLLEEYDLPIIDIYEENITFFKYSIKNKTVGVVGIETHGNSGLLRSLAVIPNSRNKSIGEQLVTYVIEYCKSKKLSELYLLTTTATKYFPKFGFSIIEKSSTPKLIQNSREFADLCPGSAIVMKLNL